MSMFVDELAEIVERYEENQYNIVERKLDIIKAFLRDRARQGSKEVCAITVRDHADLTNMEVSGFAHIVQQRLGLRVGIDEDGWCVFRWGAEE